MEIALILCIPIILLLILVIKKNKYFKSSKFLTTKEQMSSVISEYNELSNYIVSMSNSLDINASNDSLKNSHLAKVKNIGKFNVKRKKYRKELNDTHVYNASLHIVKKASEEPIKYFVKYFNIAITEQSLQDIQRTLENVSRITNANENLKLRQKQIENMFNLPKYITIFFKHALFKKLNVTIPKINLSPPRYEFRYVSAGGKSSQKTTIFLNEETLEAISEYIANILLKRSKVNFQQMLMTKKLREHIKNRDNHTCQICKISSHEQHLLLLEVDHIIPISKGGLSQAENLQTLCWQCNRTKSNEILNRDNT